MKTALSNFLVMLFVCQGLAVSQAGTFCYYNGDSFSKNAQHPPSVTSDNKKSRSHKKASLTCTPTGAFSEGASYSSDGTSCRQCGRDNAWRDVDLDSCRKAQVCFSPPEWMDAPPDANARPAR